MKSLVQLKALHPFVRNGLVISAALVILTGSYLHWKQNQAAVVASTPPKAQKIPTDIAIFSTQSNPIRNKTLVRIRYQLPKHPTPIWLTLRVKEGAKPVSILVAHPLLDQLKWPLVRDTNYSLYQRQPDFISVTEFLRNPPQTTQIALETNLFHHPDLPIPQPQQVNLDQIESLEGVDYILTTYHPPYFETNQGYWISESIVDASEALIRDDTLNWQLTIDDAQEADPLWMYGIEVDYRQPK